jgi:hypothetical protein
VNEHWVHEDKPRGEHRATVHDAACELCKGGRGATGAARHATDTWHGPFAGLPDAEAAARGTGGKMIYCPRCRPDRAPSVGHSA